MVPLVEAEGEGLKRCNRGFQLALHALSRAKDVVAARDQSLETDEELCSGCPAVGARRESRSGKAAVSSAPVCVGGLCHAGTGLRASDAVPLLNVGSVTGGSCDHLLGDLGVSETVHDDCLFEVLSVQSSEDSSAGANSPNKTAPLDESPFVSHGGLRRCSSTNNSSSFPFFHSNDRRRRSLRLDVIRHSATSLSGSSQVTFTQYCGTHSGGGSVYLTHQYVCIGKGGYGTVFCGRFLLEDELPLDAWRGACATSPPHSSLFQSPDIQLNDMEEGSSSAEGSSSHLFSVDTLLGHLVAVKVVDLHHPSLKQVNDMYNVVDVWQEICHRNIICPISIHVNLFKEPWLRLQVVSSLDLATGGSLAQFLKEREALSEAEAVVVLRDILEALTYLHDVVGRVHNDVKPRNILLFPQSSWGTAEGVDACNRATGGSSTVYRLTDLDFVSRPASIEETAARMRDFSGESDTDVLTLKGTTSYMSPEGCLGLETCTKSDSWSVGILAFQLVTGRLPWTDLELEVPELLRHGFRRKYSQLLSAGNDTATEYHGREHSAFSFGPVLAELEDDGPGDNQFSENYKKLVHWCLTEDPTQRPSTSQLLQLPLFTQRPV